MTWGTDVGSSAGRPRMSRDPGDVPGVSCLTAIRSSYEDV